MKILNGKPISPGYAQGQAVILGIGDKKIASDRIEAGAIDDEIARFHAALESSRRELEQLQARVASELGESSAEIFSAHLLFLDDLQFIEQIENLVRTEHNNLEFAIQQATDDIARRLNEADDPYLRERSADMIDLQRRLLRQLSQAEKISLSRLSSDSILVTREVLPSDLLEFEPENLAGIITEIGGETGHAAILARALGVPAVSGITQATQLITPEAILLVNGQTGEVILEPEPSQLATSSTAKTHYDATTKEATDAESRECITLDGVGVRLLANVGRPFEVKQVLEHSLDGVGLFRTEYLFLGKQAAPSIEEQYDCFCHIARSLGGKPLVVRTADFGGDKWPRFLEPRFEANPNLGVRGLRFSLLASQDLFRAQMLAAILASREHDVRIMFPMVIGHTDLQEAISVVKEIACSEGIREIPPIGALIETPSAVFAIEEILQLSDFISIGTNDLTQFVLAVDRNALALIDDYTVLHPSVLRAVSRVIDAAVAAGKPVTVCGEAAADAGVAGLLVGLGVRRLSMSPANAARVRLALTASNLTTLEALAHAALRSESATAVSRLVTESLCNTLPQLGSGAITV
ncbi:phosphoenolpyruvate--protein phosphotransferase [Methylomarinum vadi]|uniref:phosphoenolpyruvate--protein phosphotransferase n=1 Tax=Methylomarinum vadi TaxID=438855 RepID=UPI001267A504|nr:phosphoenolpyruvate--protein phosphotransferase [Methylomarinum vadi]